MTAKERLLKELEGDRLDKCFDGAELKMLRLLRENEERTMDIMTDLFDEILEILYPLDERPEDDGDEPDEPAETLDIPEPSNLILHTDNPPMVENDGEEEMS